jgi:hypothetical protein
MVQMKPIYTKSVIYSENDNIKGILYYHYHYHFKNYSNLNLSATISISNYLYLKHRKQLHFIKLNDQHLCTFSVIIL